MKEYTDSDIKIIKCMYRNSDSHEEWVDSIENYCRLLEEKKLSYRVEYTPHGQTLGKNAAVVILDRMYRP